MKSTKQWRVPAALAALALTLALAMGLASCDTPTSVPPGVPGPHTVTFYGYRSTEGAVTEAIADIGHGTAITLPGPGALTRTAHAFAGWRAGSPVAETVLKADADFIVNASVTMYAAWNAAEGARRHNL